MRYLKSLLKYTVETSLKFAIYLGVFWAALYILTEYIKEFRT